MPGFDLGSIFGDQLMGMLKGPGNLSPMKWHKGAKLLVQLIGLLKIVEICIFSASNSVCEFGTTKKGRYMIMITQSSTVDYVAAICTTMAKEPKNNLFGLVDAVLMLFAVVAYMGILGSIGVHLKTMQSILESVPGEVVGPTSVKLTAESISIVKKSAKWKNAKKKSLLSLAGLAVLIAGVGAVIYWVFNGKIEYLNEVKCDLAQNHGDLAAEVQHKELYCIFTQAGTMEFVHSCTFYLSSLASVLFGMFMVNIFFFFQRVEYAGVFTYDIEKFDLDQKGENPTALDQVNNIFASTLQGVKERAVDALLGEEGSGEPGPSGIPHQRTPAADPESGSGTVVGGQGVEYDEGLAAPLLD